MHDPSLDVKAKQKEPAGNIPQKNGVRGEALATDTNKNENIFTSLFQKGAYTKLNFTVNGNDPGIKDLTFRVYTHLQKA